MPDELDTYRGVAAPSRKAVTDDPEGPIEMPKVCVIHLKALDRLGNQPSVL